MIRRVLPALGWFADLAPWVLLTAVGILITAAGVPW